MNFCPLKKIQFINLLCSFLNQMVHLGLKNQINTWILTYSLDLTWAQPSPSCSKNLCYFKKKYMKSPRHICEVQQHRNKSEWDQPEELCLLQLFLFSNRWNLEHKALLKTKGDVLFLLSFPTQPFIITFSLFIFSICKTSELTDLCY